jgi:hypothetical protein
MYLFRHLNPHFIADCYLYLSGGFMFVCGSRSCSGGTYQSPCSRRFVSFAESRAVINPDVVRVGDSFSNGLLGWPVANYQLEFECLSYICTVVRKQTDNTSIRCPTITCSISEAPLCCHGPRKSLVRQPVNNMVFWAKQ